MTTETASGIQCSLPKAADGRQKMQIIRDATEAGLAVWFQDDYRYMTFDDDAMNQIIATSRINSQKVVNHLRGFDEDLQWLNPKDKKQLIVDKAKFISACVNPKIFATYAPSTFFEDAMIPLAKAFAATKKDYGQTAPGTVLKTEGDIRRAILEEAVIAGGISGATGLVGSTFFASSMPFPTNVLTVLISTIALSTVGMAGYTILQGTSLHRILSGKNAISKILNDLYERGAALGIQSSVQQEDPIKKVAESVGNIANSTQSMIEAVIQEREQQGRSAA